MINNIDSDIHILKYFSSFVRVSNGKVMYVTEPKFTFCPLAKHLYQDFRNIFPGDKEALREVIKKAIESKIKDYGFFTDSRKLLSADIAIPYGASEMLMFALRKKTIEAAVVVCDGVGTVILRTPELVQGVGARMNSLLLTSPIKSIMDKLKSFGCDVVFDNALINQFRGVRKAIKLGHKVIAVTLAGYSAEDLKSLRELEKESGVKIISLAICTTGISKDKVILIRDYADLVWSCVSSDIRETIGPAAKLQFSKQIPVFVLTSKGIDFVSAYAQKPEHIKDLDFNKQYFVASKQNIASLGTGDFSIFLREATLPVTSSCVSVFESNEKRSVSNA